MAITQSPNPETGWVTPGYGGEAIAIYFEHCQVREPVDAHHLRLVLPCVVQGDGDGFEVFHDVVIGKDVTPGVENNP